MITTVAALGSATVAKKPADADHPYGYGKNEFIGSWLVAIIMAIEAIFIAYHSIESFFEKAAVASYIALAAAVISLYGNNGYMFIV